MYIEVKIFTTAAGKASEQNNTPKKKTKDKSTIAISGEVGDLTFNDVLKDFRDALGVRPGRASIKSLRNTKEDKLLFVID